MADDLCEGMYVPGSESNCDCVMCGDYVPCYDFCGDFVPCNDDYCIDLDPDRPTCEGSCDALVCDCVMCGDENPVCMNDSCDSCSDGECDCDGCHDIYCTYFGCYDTPYCDSECECDCFMSQSDVNRAVIEFQKEQKSANQALGGLYECDICVDINTIIENTSLKQDLNISPTFMRDLANEGQTTEYNRSQEVLRKIQDSIRERLNRDVYNLEMYENLLATKDVSDEWWLAEVNYLLLENAATYLRSCKFSAGQYCAAFTCDECPDFYCDCFQCGDCNCFTSCDSCRDYCDCNCDYDDCDSDGDCDYDDCDNCGDWNCEDCSDCD